MASRGSRNVNADPDPLEQARLAAERAGLSLEDWLDEARRAVGTGQAPKAPLSGQTPSRGQVQASNALPDNVPGRNRLYRRSARSESARSEAVRSEPAGIGGEISGRLDELEPRELEHGELEHRLTGRAPRARDRRDGGLREGANGDGVNGTGRVTSIEGRLDRLAGAIGGSRVSEAAATDPSAGIASNRVSAQAGDMPSTLRTIARHLDRIGATPAERKAVPQSATDQSATDQSAADQAMTDQPGATIKTLEDRLQQLARRMGASRDRTPDRPRNANFGANVGTNDTADRVPDHPARNGAAAIAEAAAETVPDPITPRDDRPLPPGELPLGPPADSATTGLKQAIAEIASRQKTLETEFNRTVDGYADRIDHRIDSVAERLERSIDEASARTALSTLRDEIVSANVAPDPQHTKDFADLRLMVTDLAHRMEAVPNQVAEDLAERLEDTMRRLDTATRGELDAIRGEVREIAKDLDNGTRGEFEALRGDVVNLARLVTAAPEQLNTQVNLEIDQRLQDITARVETATRKEIVAFRAEVRDLVAQMEADIGAALQANERNDAEALRSLSQDLTRQIAGSTRDDFEALRGDVADLARLMADTPARLSEDTDARLGDIIARIETATRQEIGEFRAEIREIIARIEQGGRSEFEVLREEVLRLAERIETMPAPVVPEIEPWLEDIAARLDTATRAEFAGIRAELGDFTARFDEAGLSEFRALRTEVQDLGTQLRKEILEELVQERDNAITRDELELVRSDIRGLSTQIDGVRRDEYDALRSDMQMLGERILEAPNGRINELERHLFVLTEQLAQASQDADPDQLALIEEKINRLSDALDASSQGMAGLGDLEKSIGALFERMEENRAEAVGAAQEAAQAAVERAISSLSAGAESSDVFNDLRAEINAQRANAEAADQQHQDTLLSVHDTLKAIVGRLEELEADGAATPASDNRTMAKAAKAAKRRSGKANTETTDDPVKSDLSPAGVHGTRSGGTKSEGTKSEGAKSKAAGAEKAKSGKIAPESGSPEDDTPLVPGSGKPKHVDGRMTGGATPSATAEPPVDGADFVAAARRAARAATEAAAAEDLTAAQKRSRLAGLREGLARYRRPIVLVAATAVILFGAYKAATTLSGGSFTLPMLGASDIERGSDIKTGSVKPSVKPAGAEATVASAGPASQSGGSREDMPGNPVRQVSRSGPAHDTPKPATRAQSPKAANTKSASTPLAAKPEKAAEAATIDRATTAAVTGRPAASDTVPYDLLPDRLAEALKRDDPTAQFEIAARYMDGRGLPQDYPTASHWYRKAAAQGLAPAQYRLGSLYEKGQGVERDLAMARMWYQRAAEQGNRKAMHNLAVLYADGIDGAPDFQKAAVWFRQAAEFGLGDSQFNLAVLFARGLGVNTDLGESFRWFAIAADQGDVEALDKRDQIARDLDEETLRKARAALDAWQPKRPDASANVVPEPQGGWGDVQRQRQAFVNRDMVIAAQARLSELGYAPGPADGQIGPRTRNAVRAYQRSVGLPDTGDITPDLIERLNAGSG